MIFSCRERNDGDQCLCLLCTHGLDAFVFCTMIPKQRARCTRRRLMVESGVRVESLDDATYDFAVAQS
jgi:hypothetical protein